MSRYKQELGLKGEGLAVRFLRRKGYKIITRNFSCQFGEIDIIARQKKTTVFIEVKTRTSCGFGTPEEALNSEKIIHLQRSAEFYIKKSANPEGMFRFDVVSIILEKPPKVCLIENAF